MFHGDAERDFLKSLLYEYGPLALKDCGEVSEMSEFFGREYNYDVFSSGVGESALLTQIAHAGEEPPDFTLPSLDGDTVTLSKLRSVPVVIEFGSIT